MAQLIDPSTATYSASPFVDAVLTPSHAVSSTGSAGDLAAPREGIDLNLVDRPRPVVEIGRRMPLLAGRTAELDDLSDGIRSGQSFEVFAAEGFGKTSLVNMLLHDKPDLKGYFADGEVLLSGRSVAPGDLIGALFRAFYSAEQAVALDEGEMLRRLSPVKALVVLDGVDIDEEELQEIIAALASPVFIVTSPKRRLHDFMSRAIGPLQDEDLIAVAALRLGFELNETDQQLVVQLAHLVDDSPRSWARALELVENREELATMVARLDGAREPRVETARLALDQTSPAALSVVTLISELKGTGASEELLEEVLDIDDSSALTVEIESQGLGLMQDGLLTVSDDIADLASERMDGERVMGAALDRLLEWSQTAEPEELVEEVASITAFADWALENDRAEDVVELGRVVDGPLFQKGRWGAAAALLLLVRRAGEQCGRPADAAWAMHQMGVRELALGDRAAAKPLLREARTIRHRLGDKAGEALTQQHLKLLGPMAALTAPFVAKFVLGFLLAAGAITGGVIAFTQADDSLPPDTTATTTIPTPTTIVAPERPGLAAELAEPTSIRVSFALDGLNEGEQLQVIRVSPDGSEEVVVETAVLSEFLDRGLQSESTYRYRARITGGEEASPWSDEVVVTTETPDDSTPPAAPTGLVGTFEESEGGGRVSLTWNPATEDDLAGYDILRDGTVLSQNEAEAEYVDDSPISGSSHTYQVVAVDTSSNPSDASEPEDVLIPIDSTKPPVVVPPTPTGLAGSYTREAGITLTWIGTADSYSVERAGWGSPRVVSQERVVDAEVIEGETYTYTVRARRAGVSSPPSAARSIPAVVIDIPPPTAPGQPSVGVVGDVLRIKWTPPSGYDFAVTYEVWRDATRLADEVGGTTWDEDPLPADGNYSYTIVAVNDDGEASAPSQAGKITVGAAMVTVSIDIVGVGGVTSDSGGISCPGICEGDFEVGDEVTLEATGSAFAGWSGNCYSIGSDCTLTLDSDTSVSAFFGTVDPIVTVDVGGSGIGVITSDPSGIDCPTSCSALYQEGDNIVLTATVDEFSEFGGWSGDCSGTSLTCALSVSGDLNAIASFDVPPPQTLTVNVVGTGIVTSNASGINCSAPSCSEPLPKNSTVVLTATGTGGSTFAGWSSGECAGTGTCVLSMSSAKAVTATFDAAPPPQTLSADVSGLGTGTITSSPSGISCSPTCSSSFDKDSDVTLTATPTGGSTFDGWISGLGCPATNTCTVTMDSDVSITAFFAPPVVQFPLEVDVMGTGTVISSPAGISCSSGTCSDLFDEDEVVTLSATPSGGDVFAGWSSTDCSGTGSCQLTMTAAKAVLAVFEPPPDTTPPNAPTGLYFDLATYDLVWNASTSADVVEYQIYEIDDGYEAYVSHPTTSYYPDFCNTDYRVTAVDAAGNESTPTSWVFVMDWC